MVGLGDKGGGDVRVLSWVDEGGEGSVSGYGAADPFELKGVALRCDVLAGLEGEGTRVGSRETESSRAGERTVGSDRLDCELDRPSFAQHQSSNYKEVSSGSWNGICTPIANCLQ